MLNILCANPDEPFMVKTLLITATLIFAGCASITEISVKDGKPLYEAKCRTSTADCHRLASEKCGGQYDIVDTSKHIVDNYMTFQCR